MENTQGRDPSAYCQHRDGNRFHVRCLNGEMQVFGVELEHVAMCRDLATANMVAYALERAAETPNRQELSGIERPEPGAGASNAAEIGSGSSGAVGEAAFDADECRRRNVNAIRNTATGHWLEKALREIQRLR